MKDHKEITPEFKTATVFGITNLIAYPLAVSLIPIERRSAEFTLSGLIAVNALLLNILAKKGETLAGKLEEGAKAVMNNISEALGGNPVLGNNPLENFFKRAIRGGGVVFDEAASAMQRMISR